MPRLALGLFHFNTQYIAGDASFADRYCSEALEPFLDAVAARAGWRVSLEMAGSGLEFVAERHPRTFESLRTLVAGGKIELISALYTPAIWVAFPRRDLLQSVLTNRRILAALGLRDAGIFFAQEGFFGPGVSVLAEHFRYALCKDEYLAYFSTHDRLSPCYSLDGIRVIVGSGHLANLLAAIHSGRALPEPHRRRLDSVPANIPQATEWIGRGAAGGVEWLWYHMGSGHHFATPYSPEDFDRFFFDPQWAALNFDLLDSIAGEDYSFGTIGEFAELLGNVDAPPLPPVIEGSWNTRKSRGVFAWMGEHPNAWEDDPSILGFAWRSREALVRSEAAADPVELDRAWRAQLIAEGSDPLGWAPLQGEVRFGRTAAEQALAAARRLPDGASEIERALARLPAEPMAAAELYGGDGEFTVIAIAENVQQIDVRLSQTSTECGIRFRRSEDVRYCPSALEDSPTAVRFEDYRPSVLYLPLANGFLGLGNAVAVIRVNRFGMPAARVAASEPFVAFGVEGGRRASVHRWRFLFYRGSVEAAVACANTVNSV